MLTTYALRLLDRHAFGKQTGMAGASIRAGELVSVNPDGWKPVSGSGMRKPAVRLAFAPRKSGPVWMVRVRGRVVFESPDKTAALAHRDALLPLS